MPSSKVAILLATHNGADYLLEQLSSIFSQIGVQCTIFFSDDNSTDTTVEILENLRCTNMNTHKLSFGSAAANFIHLISTFDEYQNFDYVMLSDQDDIWLPNKIIQAIQKMSEVNACTYFGSFYPWDHKKISYFNIENKYTNYLHLFGNLSPGFTFSFTSIAFLKIQKIINEKFEHLGELRWHDWLLYFIVKEHKLQYVVSADAHTLYRQHSNNDTGLAINIDAIKMRIKYLFSDEMDKQLNILMLFAVQSGSKKLLKCALRLNLTDRFHLLCNLTRLRKSLISRVALALWIIGRVK